MFKIYNNQKAFGIIEVLVAAGLMSIIGVGISSLITNAAKQQKGIQAKDQQREVTSEIRSLLSNKTACLNTFTGLTITGGTVANIRDATNAVVYTVGGADKTGLLNFTEFGLSNFIADASAPPLTAGNIDFKIKLTKVGDVGNVKEIKPDLITLKIKRNAGGTITECFSVGTQADGVWQISPTNSNNIFYPAGKVGIGPSEPLATAQQFEISENMLIPTAVAATNGNLFFGGNTNAGTNGMRLFNLEAAGGGFIDMKSAIATNGIIFRADTVNGGTERMRIRADGNVGIGDTAPVSKLAVNGRIDSNSLAGAGGYISTGNLGGTGTAAWFPTGIYSGGPNNWIYGAVYTNGTIASASGGYSITNAGAFSGTTISGTTHYGTAFQYTSDARLKKNIIDFTEGLNFVNKMRPVRYQWKSNSKHDIGFIAQDIEKIAPELTGTDDKGIKRIDYAKMVPILVKAIQEQQIQIDQLKKQLNQK